MTQSSSTQASTPHRIYLDNAATTWPKNEKAVEAAFDFVKRCGATAGRGAYTSSQQAERWLRDARSNLARLIGGEDGNSIAICSSGTHALNACLQGLLLPGDHVVATEVEHNSVLRPLKALVDSRQIKVDFAPSDPCGRVMIEEAAKLVDGNTKLLCIGHASNVTGAVQDLPAWKRLAEQHGALLLVDASQTLGYFPINVRELGIDFLAAAGHKGLRALPGTGFLYARSVLQSQLVPSQFGGTGRASELIDGGQPWPASIEVGNLNMPGVVSMAVAAADLLDSAEAMLSWKRPFEMLRAGLRSIEALRVLGEDPSLDFPRVPLLSVVANGWSVHDLASVLDTSFGIEVRAGLHCAALIHRRLNSSDGTLRLSTGHSTSIAEIDATLSAFHEIFGGTTA